MSEIMRKMGFVIDLDHRLVTMPQRGHLVRDDMGADEIRVRILRNGEAADLTGVTCGGKFYRPPDGAMIALEGRIEGGEAVVELTDHCYAAEGFYQAEVYLNKDDKKVTVLSISGHVRRAGSGAVVDLEGVIPSIDALLAMISDIDAAKKAAYEAAGIANAAAAALEGMRANARTVAYESGASVTVENQGGRYILTFNIPRGAPGSIDNVSVNSIPGLRDQLDARITREQLLDLAYPIGSIYMSTASASPAVFLGGEWERLEDAFLLGASADYPAGSRGGAAEVSLTGEQNGPHTHGLKITKNKAASGSALARIDTDSSTPSGSLITESGEGAPHENMPPYLAVYMWQRTA